MTTMAEKFPAGHISTGSQFEGRKAAVVALKMKPTILKELSSELSLIRKLEGAIKELLRHYPVKNPGLDKVMSARSQLFSNFVKLALKIGAALDSAQLKCAATKSQLKQETRNGICGDIMRGQLADIEHRYRTSLMHALSWTESDLPPAVNAKVDTTSTPTSVAPTPVSVAGLIAHNADGEVEITESIILKRLHVFELPASVGLADLTFLKDRCLYVWECRRVWPMFMDVDRNTQLPL